MNPSLKQALDERGIKYKTAKGGEAVARCPFHDDKKPSLSLNFDKNVFFCHACGAKGNTTRFVAMTDNVPVDEVKKKLKKAKTDGPPAPPQPKLTPVVPVPIDAPDLETAIQTPKADEGAVYSYLTPDGDLAFYVFRKNLPRGEKIFFPVCFTQEAGWQKTAAPAPRPLYRLPMLIRNPALPVLVVEGEKAADHAAKLFDKKYLATTWCGGANSVHNADWNPLKNRNVIVCPDNDKPGRAAAEKIVAILQKIGAASVSLFAPPDDWPERADWADFKGDKQEALEILKSRTAIVATSGPKSTEHDPFMGKINILGKQISDNSKHIEIVVHIPGCGIVHVQPAEITPKTMLSIVPDPQFWLELYTRHTGELKAYQKFGSSEMTFDVVQILVNTAEAKGDVQNLQTRGRGVWKDKKGLAVHNGAHVHIDGKKHDAGLYTDEAVYNKRPKINLDPNPDKPFTLQQTLVQTCEMLQFKNPADNKIFAGWLALAPVCGILPWRPHLWITGPAQTGKSWALTLAKKILSNIHVFRQGESTTEAALRQELGNDALPVLFDEADVSANKTTAFQNIMAFARAASSPDAPPISKGTQHGKHATFACRSMFLFASIAPNVFLDQDKSRFHVIEMKKTSEQPKKEKEVQFKKTCNHNLALLETQAHAYFAFVYHNVHKLLNLIDSATETLVNMGLHKRAADQYGTLAAGYALLSQQPLDDFIHEFFAAADENKKNRAEAHETVAEYILAHKFDRHDLTVAQVLSDYINAEKNTPAHDNAKTLLATLGLAVDPKKQHLLVPARNPQLEKIFKHTEFALNYHDLLARFDGTQKNAFGRTFDGRPAKFLKIPIDKIIPEQEPEQNMP